VFTKESPFLVLIQYDHLTHCEISRLANTDPSEEKSGDIYLITPQAMRAPPPPRGAGVSE